MNPLLIKYYRIFDQLSLAIKSVILVSFLVLTFIIWYYGGWQNLQQSIAAATNKIEVLRLSISGLKAQLEALEKEVKTQKELLSKNEDALISSSTMLLSPHQTTKVLHSILVANNKLSLLQLKNMPPKEISLPQSNFKIFEHGIMIKFSGDYFSTMQYLQTVENLKWKIFWDKLEYKVTQYPLAEITLYIHTISTEGDWIHV